ncbi:hypothetical protein L195_g019493 [Trifolium pratense]|uniref:Transmembrane protein n=1 Tax=Trifolium pratense TaxID=57577 RepID=A0A2K3MZS1_TRIPR|nr:hypothetical protein L195_g019493 [Trifolium pratense]
MGDDIDCCCSSLFGWWCWVVLVAGGDYRLFGVVVVGDCLMFWGGGGFFSSLCWFPNPLGFAGFLYLVDLYRVGVDCLVVVGLAVGFFSSLCWFPNPLGFASFLYLVDLYRIGVNCLETDCKLRRICLGFLSTVAPSSLAHRVAFWILMGRSLLIRDRELASSDIFLGRMMSSLVVWKLRSILLRMGLELDLY